MPADPQRYHGLPSVDALMERVLQERPHIPRTVVKTAVRRALDQARQTLQDPAAALPNPADLAQRSLRDLDALAQPSLRRVINATGVVLHTNLGRAPLPPIGSSTGYTNLEYGLATGKRGKRDSHLAPLLEALLGYPGIVVNNNAAALYLALLELAAGREVIVSRGELVEIGDGFRIPEIMASSGAILREVGATNRTRISDYAQAINERTSLLLLVHPSNFQIRGFTGKPDRKEIVELAHSHNLPVLEDIGSGLLADLSSLGIHEPRPQEALAAGVDLVCFSGDKLLGGAQAGFLTGQPELIQRLRRNPMFRALRASKQIFLALEQVLRSSLFERWEEIPALAMIRLTPTALRERAERLAERLQLDPASVVPGESVIGGGSTPAQSLPTWLVPLPWGPPQKLEQRLRLGDPPVIARIQENRVVLDPRTILEEEEAELVEALQKAASAISPPPVVIRE